MPYFRVSRNLELSTVYYLETQLTADWTGITVVKSFKNAYDATLPVVCIRLQDIIFGRKELGSTALFDTYGFIIDIFARSDAQRLDLADYIEDKIKGSWAYYTHSHASGTNAEIVRSDGGTKIVLETITENRKVEISDNPEQQDRYRHIISFVVRKYV